MPGDVTSAAALRCESVRELLYRAACTGQPLVLAQTLQSVSGEERELLNRHDQQGQTLLMKAAMQGNEDAVNALIQNAAFVNAKVRLRQALLY